MSEGQSVDSASNNMLQRNSANKSVFNRGITPDQNGHHDQLIDAIDYEQIIHQKVATDSPSSTLKAKNGGGIHHEPGFFMQILNHDVSDSESVLKIARLATIPHGDSVLAMGKVSFIDGAPTIPDLNALPQRINADVQNNQYLVPYKYFGDKPFFGTVPGSTDGFPVFFQLMQMPSCNLPIQASALKKQPFSTLIRHLVVVGLSIFLL